jgi:hypothetical protein
MKGDKEERRDRYVVLQDCHLAIMPVPMHAAALERA